MKPSSISRQNSDIDEKRKAGKTAPDLSVLLTSVIKVSLMSQMILMTPGVSLYEFIIMTEGNEPLLNPANVSAAEEGRHVLSQTIA